MTQLNLFAPCQLLLEIRHAVRTDGPQPTKHCACERPCWSRNGSNTRTPEAMAA